jgi:phosphoribosylformimino-5-aminoimidazole carboxamide ribotide isomerase
MELLPAIDLRAGAAVRLTQGDFDRETRYGDPVELAARFVAGGARWLHVVDLEAARTGVPHERATLEKIVRMAEESSVRVEAGGGVRTEDAAEELLDVGVARVVLGTAALEDPDVAGRCARRWPERIAVGLDYRMGDDGSAEAQAQGWLTGSGRSVTDLLELWAGEPIGAVVVTAVARDGTLAGPEVEGLTALLLRTELPIVASGGVGSTRDLDRLAHLRAGGRRLAGVIVGRALVERRFNVEEGLAACAASA